MIAFFKRLFCKHYEVTFVRNIYGDEIIEWGYKRSLRKCNKCGAIVPGDFLHSSEQDPNEKAGTV